MRISVFGLGYVGTVCAACLARDGHAVVGVDINQGKVDAINAGVAPIVEPDIVDLVKEARTHGRLSATTSSAEGVRASDITFVCVGTPSQANGSLDLTYLRRVCEDIGMAVRDKASPHLVVLRSTMLPGTSEDVLMPILEKSSGKGAGHGLEICYNPEFLREGSSVHDFDHPPKIVVGEKNPGSGEPLLQLLAKIQAPIVRTSIRVAEMVKYTDNAFHALKVTFANEIGNLSKKMGVDSHEVMSIFCQDTKLNLAPTYLGQSRGDVNLLSGYQAESGADVPEARLRVRRLLSAEGPPRPNVPSEAVRPGEPGAERDLAIECRTGAAGDPETADSGQEASGVPGDGVQAQY
jgi:GDP-mannose 6-dehydrogenase